MGFVFCCAIDLLDSTASINGQRLAQRGINSLAIESVTKYTHTVNEKEENCENMPILFLSAEKERPAYNVTSAPIGKEKCRKR